MIFGFGKKREESRDDEEIEYVTFQGSLSGQEADLQKNAKLADAGLNPTKEIITDALSRRCDRIRVEPKGERSAITLYVDGIPYPGPRLLKAQGLAVTQFTKLISGLDPKERTKVQSGGLKAEHEGTKYILKVDITPVQGGGERMTIAVRDAKLQLELPEEVGFPDELHKKVRVCAVAKQGAVLVCGPTYSGVSSTLFATMRSIDAYMQSMFTTADLGRDLINITKYTPKADEDFETVMIKLGRMEANIIVVPPIRSAEQAREILAQHEEMNLMAEFMAADAAAGILKMVEWAEDPELVTKGLKLIISQKLIRRLCEKCREAYKPNSKMIQKIGLPDETKLLYRPPSPPDPNDKHAPDPCDKCGAVGFFGRIALFEYIEMTDGIKELVRKKAGAPALRQQAKKEGMLTFQKDAIRLVADGKTSLDELQRTFKDKEA